MTNATTNKGKDCSYVLKWIKCIHTDSYSMIRKIYVCTKHQTKKPYLVVH